MHAMELDHIDVVKYLIHQGADINAFTVVCLFNIITFIVFESFNESLLFYTVGRKHDSAESYGDIDEYSFVYLFLAVYISQSYVARFFGMLRLFFRVSLLLYYYCYYNVIV